MHTSSRWLLPCVALLSLSSASAHAADADWFASLYTPEGVELRADERVFTLYALFNAMGYDAGRQVRAHPLPKVEFHPVRKLVRQRMLTLPADVRTQAEAFFDAHPVPMADYVAAALGAEPSASKLKGLDGLLHSVRKAAKTDEVWGEAQAEYRKALRAYLPALDGPMSKSASKWKEKAPVLVLNLLDAEGTVLPGVTVGKERIIVVGPSAQPNVDGVLKAWASRSVPTSLDGQVLAQN